MGWYLITLPTVEPEIVHARDEHCHPYHAADRAIGELKWQSRFGPEALIQRLHRRTYVLVEKDQRDAQSNKDDVAKDFHRRNPGLNCRSILEVVEVRAPVGAEPGLAVSSAVHVGANEHVVAGDAAVEMSSLVNRKGR